MKGLRVIRIVNRTFTNEHGDEVNIRIVTREDALVMIMTDDETMMENVITPNEAENLWSTLGQALGK